MQKQIREGTRRSSDATQLPQPARPPQGRSLRPSGSFHASPTPMAPSLLAAASASSFLLAGSCSSRRPLGAAPTRRAGLRVAALKYEPAKVCGLAAVMMRSRFESSRSFGWNSWSNGVVLVLGGRWRRRTTGCSSVSSRSLRSLRYQSIVLLFFVLFRFIRC